MCLYNFPPVDRETFLWNLKCKWSIFQRTKLFNPFSLLILLHEIPHLFIIALCNNFDCCDHIEKNTISIEIQNAFALFEHICSNTHWIEGHKLILLIISCYVCCCSSHYHIHRSYWWHSQTTINYWVKKCYQYTTYLGLLTKFCEKTVRQVLKISKV